MPHRAEAELLEDTGFGWRGVGERQRGLKRREAMGRPICPEKEGLEKNRWEIKLDRHSVESQAVPN